MRKLIPIVAAMLVIGCHKDKKDPVEPDLQVPVNMLWADVGLTCAPGTPVVPLSAARRDSIAPPSHRYSDVIWADIARTAPGGWGGYYRLDGVPTILLVDPAQRASAIAAIQAGGVAVPSSAVAAQGRWDFAQLFDWYSYLSMKVWRGTGLMASDVQERWNRIEYYVQDEASRSLLEARLRDLGVPCGLVSIGIMGPISAAR